MVEVFQIKRESVTAILPTRATAGSIGYDVCADTVISHPNGIVIKPGQRALIPLGFSMACPEGTYGRLAPRSGLSNKHGIHVLAGVIDPDYRGQVFACLLNTSQTETLTVTHGMRVAQLILEQARIFPIQECYGWEETVRGDNGFGSSGV